MSYDMEGTFILAFSIPAAFSLVLFVGTWIYELSHRTGSSDRTKSSLASPTPVSSEQAYGQQISFLAEINNATLAWFMALLGRPERQVKRAVKLLEKGQINSSLSLIEQALTANGPQWMTLRRILISHRLEIKEDLKLRMQEAINKNMKKQQLELKDISEALLYYAWNASLPNLAPLQIAHISYVLGQYYLRLGSISERIRFDYRSAARNCFEHAQRVFHAENQTIEEIRALDQLIRLLGDAVQRKQGDTVISLDLARDYYELAMRACDNNDPPIPPDLCNQIRDALQQVNAELGNI